VDDDLLRKYLSGEATDEEAARLRGELERDPAGVEALFAAAELERDLSDVVSKAPARRAFRARRRSAWPLLAAAAALLAIGVGVWFVASRPTPVGEIVRVQGTVRFADGRPAAPGDALFAGQGLETVGGRSGAAIRFADGTHANLNGGTRLSRIDEDGAGRRLKLDTGTVNVETKRPLVIETPQAEVKVLGTRFKISAAENGTRLEVETGRVRLRRISNGTGIDVPAGHFAVAAAGVELVAKPIAPARSKAADLVARMPPKSWFAAPDTKMRQVVPDPAKFPRIQAVSGPKSVVSSWSGAALDSRRNQLIVWGGGTSSYYGNEVYAFRVDDLAWERVTEPSTDLALGQQINRDGTPAARSTYSGLAYIAHADRLFALGGVIADNRGNTGADVTWTFDPGSRRWFNMNPSGTRPQTGAQNLCAYDPDGRKVWWFDRLGLFSYDFAANRWMKAGEDIVHSRTCAVDTKRGLLVVVGQGEVLAYDLRAGAPARQVWKTRAGDAFVAKERVGLDYDPLADRIVGWAGGAVHALDPESKVWDVVGAPGAPAPTVAGIYGRWRYVPSLGAFVLVTDIDENVHFFKLGR